ncbi:MAG: hypothetical protein L3J23_06340 [Flavobacteriaceae bacterium]|nr:hypothetical protein [Flavobacteriaceae bacterium]
MKNIKIITAILLLFNSLIIAQVKVACVGNSVTFGWQSGSYLTQFQRISS